MELVLFITLNFASYTLQLKYFLFVLYLFFNELLLWVFLSLTEFPYSNYFELCVLEFLYISGCLIDS